MDPSARKLRLFELLYQGGFAQVWFDPRRPGVVLPVELRDRHALALNYGPRFPVPIRGLRADDHGVSALLSFDGHPHTTYVPWVAVFALMDPRDGFSAAFPADAPPEIRAPGVAPPRPAPSARRGHLSLVTTTTDPEPEAS